MKKNQNKSKSKVEERKSVANQCDYSRSNGKCGRALSENFGKPCPGRSCEDWKCDAEGTAVTVVEHRTAAVSAAGAVTVVPSHASRRDADGTVNYRDRVSEAYGRIETAKDNLLRECVKFGALLTEVGYYLGEARGRGKDGDGLKAWLEENCPEVNYSTAINYKALATKCVKMLGGGSQAVAVLQDKTEVIPPGEEEAVEVESKFIEKRDNLFNEVKSRRELEQTYFKFMAHEGKGRQGGANKGQSGTGRRALTAEEKSDSAGVEIRELVGKLIAFDKSGKFRMLTAQAQSDIVLYLKDVVKSFEEQQA